MIETLSPERGADGLESLIEHLTPPLAAGARRSVFAPDGEGIVQLPEARRPAVLLRLRRSPGGGELRVVASLQGDGEHPLRFAPWSEAGSLLPVAAGGESAASRLLKLFAALDGTELPAAELTDWFEAVQVEGNIGRLLAVLGAEKVRIRREAALLAAMRSLAFAAEDALDRVGAELGVPRLEGVPAWNKERAEIVVTPARESDSDYRARLAVWRPFLAPTPAAYRAMLAKVEPRLRIEEPSGNLAVAVKLIASADAADERTYILERLRTERLVFVGKNAPAAGAPGIERPLPAQTLAREAALRKRLGEAFDTAADMAVAPLLASALDRAGRIFRAFGGPVLKIARAQDMAGDSRYELGLGVAVEVPAQSAADVVRLLLDPLRNLPGGGVRAAPPSEDERLLGWLWRAAGFATVHRLSADQVYVSHLASGGLTVDETGRTANAITVRAALNAAGDPVATATLQRALDRAAMTSSTGFSVVEAKAMKGALSLKPEDPANQVLAASGLPVTGSGSDVAAALMKVDPGLWALLEPDKVVANEIRQGDPSAVDSLRALIDALRAGGVVSLMPVLTTKRLFLAAGAVALPVAGMNIGERASVGARWAVVPITGSASLSNGSGFTTQVQFQQPGVVAVLAFAYSRGEGPDPYELRATLGDGELLDLAQYERVMNALERAYPIGVEINTWALRQRHVDLDGDGLADPLPPAIARHYRRFRMPRLRGAEEPELDSPDFSPAPTE